MTTTLKQIAVTVPVDDSKIQLGNMVGASPVNFVDCEVDDAFLEQNLRSWQAILIYNLHSLYVKKGHISFSTIAAAQFYMEEKANAPAQPETSESGLYCVVGFCLGSKTSTTQVKATFDYFRDAKHYAKELADTSSEQRYYGVFVLDSVCVSSQSVQVEYTNIIY